MSRILKRPQAETDLDEIWWYIAQDNPDNADLFLDKIEEQCQALAQFPLISMRDCLCMRKRIFRRSREWKLTS